MTQQILWDAAAETVAMDGNPMPPNMQVGFLRARDGKLLRNAIFQPEGKARATIILMTGYSEFIEKYFETVIDLQKAGYCVVLPEWRGHGLSEGDSREPTRLHITDFDINVSDLEDRLMKLLNDCPHPYFGLAHSMGGQVSLRAAHKHADWFAALAQSAPMHGFRLPWGVQFMTTTIARFFALAHRTDRWMPGNPPATRPGEAATNQVTSDFARYERNENLYVTEPRLQVNGASLGWVLASVRAMRASARPAYLRQLTTPLFIGSAARELLVSNQAHCHVLEHVPNGQGKMYENAMHEILMEKDSIRQKFIADMLAFFESVQKH